MARVMIRLTVLLVSLALWGCASTAQQTKSLVVLMEKANLAYEQGQCEQAIELYRQLADGLRDDVDSLLRMGNCQVRLQRLDEAVQTYREAISRDPSFVKAWHNLTQVQARQLAQTVTQMSANIDPTDPASNRIRVLSERILDAIETPVDSP